MENQRDNAVKSFIALAIILTYLAVAVFLIAAPVSGLMQTSVAMDMLKTWGAIFSVLFGLVLGHYFGGRSQGQAPV